MSTVVMETTQGNVLKTLEDLQYGLLVATAHNAQPALVNLGTVIAQLEFTDAQTVRKNIDVIMGILQEAVVSCTS